MIDDESEKYEELSKEEKLSEEELANDVKKYLKSDEKTSSTVSDSDIKGKFDDDKKLDMVGILFRLMINVIFYMLAIYIIIFVSHKAYDFSYQIYGSVAVDEKPGVEVPFEVSKGDTPSKVAQRLKEDNLIKDKSAFLIRLKLCGKSLYPNKYKLSTAMNYGEIIEEICNKEVKPEQ